MIDELKAARDAAEAYVPRNEGEEAHVLFIRALMDDAVLRVGMLDDIARNHENEMNLRNAQTALNQAQAASAAPAPVAAPAPAALGPDTQLAPGDPVAVPAKDKTA